VVVVAVVAGLAVVGLVAVGVAFLIRRRRNTGAGALAYQEREKAHAQMSTFESRGNGGFADV
jgi:putative exporter of polyketide antibiotics